MREPLSERRYSYRALAWSIAGAALASMAALVIGMGGGPIWLLYISPLPLLVEWLRCWLLRKGAAYRLFPDRLEIERGILTRRIENIELFRVRDLGVRQGFLGRVTNFGDLYIHSTDASSPDVVLQAVDRPRELYEALRDQVSESRAQRQTMIVEEGGLAREGDGP